MIFSDRSHQPNVVDDGDDSDAAYECLTDISTSQGMDTPWTPNVFGHLFYPPRFVPDSLEGDDIPVFRFCHEVTVLRTIRSPHVLY